MFGFNAYSTLDIFFYCLEVQRTNNIISCNNYTFVVQANEVCHNIWLDVLKSPVNVNNMSPWVLDEIVGTIDFHRMMTCFCDSLLVVMFILGFGFSFLLMIFWNILIFLFWRLRKASLIIKVSLAMLEELDELANTWAYDFFWLVVEFFLKNLDISLTSLAVFARMGREREET